MSFAYDFIKAGKYKWAGWFDISIEPPINIHILVNIKDWGCAIGRLLDDRSTFLFSLPHENSPTYLQIPANEISHWAVIPELYHEDL